MAFPLAVVALILIVSALRGSQADLATALLQDGPGYLKWAGAFVLIGILGYVPGFETPSRLLLALVILAIALANQGVIANLAAAFTSPPAPSEVKPSTSLAQPLGPAPVQLTGAGTGAAAGAGSGGVSGAASGAQLGGALGGPYGAAAGAILGGIF